MALHEKPQVASNSKLWVPEACVRGSLDKAVLNDQHLTQWACSADPADLDAAQVCLREMANAAPPASMMYVADWDHANARKWLWEMDPDPASLVYDKHELIIAATYITAELEVSRNLSYLTIMPHIFELVKMANFQVFGYWGGRLRGLVSFVAEAAVTYGAVFEDGIVRHPGWGLYPGADRTRILQAYQDLRSFRSSLHLFAYKIGAWYVRLPGTQSDMSLGWIMNYLFTCVRLLSSIKPRSIDDEFIGDSESDDESPKSPAVKKPKAELTQKTEEKGDSAK